MDHRGSSSHLGCACILCLVLSACSVPVAGNLEERDANLVADALVRSGIDATKESDPSAEGHYRVVVPHDDRTLAIAALRDYDLPPRHTPGVLDSIGKGTLLPSPAAEHAQYVAGIAGDLERTLATVDGVLGARVHLSIPVANPLSEKPIEAPTASILLKYVGSTPPLTETDIRRLVAGAVSNMRLQDVTVVTVGRPDLAIARPRPLAHVGPIAVTRSSVFWLRGVFGVALASLLGLVTVVLYLWLRLRRAAQRAVDGNVA